MLTGRLLHPGILAALAAAGHGSLVLVTDANYPATTTRGPNAAVVHLDLTPGSWTASPSWPPSSARCRSRRLRDGAGDVGSERAAERAADLVPFSAALADAGSPVPLQPLERTAFYAAAGTPDVALTVVTGETEVYGNVMLRVGVVRIALTLPTYPDRKVLPMSRFTELRTHDVRFPTSRELDGSDAMNPDPDYSAAYVVLATDAGDGLEGARLRLHHRARQRRPGGRDPRARAVARRPRRRGRAGGPRRLRPRADRRPPAALARPREGRRPHGRRRGAQRAVGPAGQARGQAAVAAARRPRPRAARRARRLPLPHRRAHAGRGARILQRRRARPRGARSGSCAPRATRLHDVARLARLRRREARPPLPRRPSPTASA